MIKKGKVSARFIHIPLPIFGQLSEMGIMSKPCKHLWDKMQSYISINLESQLGTRNEWRNLKSACDDATSQCYVLVKLNVRSKSEYICGIFINPLILQS